MNEHQNLSLEIGEEKSLSFTEAQPNREDTHLTITNTNPYPPSSSSSSSKIQFAVSKKWETEISNGQRPKPTATNICSSLLCCCSRRVGSMFFICERRNGSPIVVAGPCWPFCTFVTLPLVAGLSGLTLYFCILKDGAPLPMWTAGIYIPLIAITLLALFMVSCQDPGLVERKMQEDRATNSFLWNEQAGSYRPPDALYCRECQVVIEDYDHLCPWTGTGIGKKNMLAFKLFVLFVNLLCYGTIAMVAYVLLADTSGRSGGNDNEERN